MSDSVQTFRVVGFWDEPTDVAEAAIDGAKAVALAAFPEGAPDVAVGDTGRFSAWTVQVQAGSAEEALRLAPALAPIDEDEQP